MKTAALLVALIIVGIGVVGVVAPDRLVAAGRSAITPLGLYAIGALRVAMGLVLILAAPISRAPRSLRVLGGLIVVAGVATPFVGIDRVRGIADWGTSQGPALLRGVALVMVFAGGLVGFAFVGARRRA